MSYMKSWFASPLRLADEKAESFGTGFAVGFRHGSAHEQLERERDALLRQPLPRDLNPPELLTPTRCRVLKPFYLGGKPTEVHQVVELPRHEALSLAAIGRCTIL